MARLLLVEDEAPLRELLARYLARLGHSVDSAALAEQAWGLFDEAPEGFDLVIVDLTLPDLSGEQLLRRMIRRRPQVRILVSSGAPFSVSLLPLADPRQAAFLQKPFLPQMLASAVDNLLGGASRKIQ